MSNLNRVPEGVPTGGQFAASARGESGVALGGQAHMHDPMAMPVYPPWDGPAVHAQAEHSDFMVRARLAEQMSGMTRDRDQAERMRMMSARDSDWEPAFQRSNKEFVATSHRLAQDPDVAVRRALATSAAFADDKTPQILAADADPWVRSTLAANARRSGLDKKIIKTLSKDPDHEVRTALASLGAHLPRRYRRRLARDPHLGVQATLRDRMRRA